MSLSIGIVGLPNVGKSTLFNALTKKAVPAENYPFCTIDPSVGIVPVPDIRLDRLSEISSSKETIPAVVEFVDIAGLVRGAAEGEGLGNQFLAHIRETDAIAMVVRMFDDPDIVHVDGEADPRRDIEVIETELMLADLATATKRLSSLAREVKSGDRRAAAEHAALESVRRALEAGVPARAAGLSREEGALVSHLHFLTQKPVLYVLNKKSGAYNIDEHPSTDADPRYRELMELLSERGAVFVPVDAGVEHELRDIREEEKDIFRRELGALGSGIDELIRKGYELLDLITFFTTGEKETRAWTIRRGATAPEAGAAIHSDFRDRFIRAQVIAYEALVGAGSYAAAREQGLVRTEGKEYIVADGDVIEFLI